MGNIGMDLIKNRLGLTVETVDGLTGRRVRDSKLKVWIENAAPAVEKAEGYYVFINLGKGDIVLRIEGSIYKSQEIKISPVKLEEYREKILQARLYREPLNSPDSHMVPMEAGGKILEGVFADNEALKNPYRLLRPYEKGDKEIFIFHPENVNIEGSSLLIKDKETLAAEVFRVQEALGENSMSYLLTMPLGNSYKKTQTLIYPVVIEKHRTSLK